MDIEKRAHLAGRVGRQIGAQRIEFVLDDILRRTEPANLGFDLIRFDEIVIDVERSRRDQIGPSDGDAAGDWNTVQRERHARLLVRLLYGASGEKRRARALVLIRRRAAIRPLRSKRKGRPLNPL